MTSSSQDNQHNQQHRDKKQLGVCFENIYMQAVHKYADMLLLIAIGMLSYWLVGLENKQEKMVDVITGVDKRVVAIEVGQVDIMRSLIEIKVSVREVNDKLYTIFAVQNKKMGAMQNDK